MKQFFWTLQLVAVCKAALFMAWIANKKIDITFYKFQFRTESGKFPLRYRYIQWQYKWLCIGSCIQYADDKHARNIDLHHNLFCSVSRLRAMDERRGINYPLWLMIIALLTGFYIGYMIAKTYIL